MFFNEIYIFFEFQKYFYIARKILMFVLFMIRQLYLTKRSYSVNTTKSILIRERTTFTLQNSLLYFASTIQRFSIPMHILSLLNEFMKNLFVSQFMLYLSLGKTHLSFSTQNHTQSKTNQSLPVTRQSLKETISKGKKTINKNILQIAFCFFQFTKSKNNLQNELSNLIIEGNKCKTEKTILQRTNANLFSEGLICIRMFVNCFTQKVIFSLQKLAFYTHNLNNTLFINLKKFAYEKS